MALLRLNENGRLALKNANGETEIQRRSLQNVLLLIDTSGSMSGNKIEQAKRGAIDFAQSVNLRGCATALAIFGDKAKMVVDPTTDTHLFAHKIERLAVGLAGGGTDLALALQLANKFKEINTVVVVTDGQTPEAPALKAAEVLKARGIDILCIGTDDADRDFLATLATRTDLAVHVRSQDLAQAIGKASDMLLLGDGR
jgi:Mg-chelatase subunit ChlD